MHLLVIVCIDHQDHILEIVNDLYLQVFSLEQNLYLLLHMQTVEVHL